MAEHKEKHMPNYAKFIVGGCAGMAACCFVQPLDLVKNRMQLSAMGRKGKEHKSTLHVLYKVIKHEGFFAVYNGLSAGLLRQATYTTTRLGIYTWLFETFSVDGKHPSYFVKAAIAMTAGCCGAFVGTPAEVALIRMTADGRLPANEKRNYKNVFHALFRISVDEGPKTLWRGALPTMGRAMVVNAAQLATYSQTKEFLLSKGYFSDNLGCHLAASMISGFVTTVASMPVDIAKTRIQTMKTIDGQKEYSGAIDVLVKVIKKEGLFSLWKGFTPYLFRLGPHTVLTFIFLEELTHAYHVHILGNTHTGGSF